MLTTGLYLPITSQLSPNYSLHRFVCHPCYTHYWLGRGCNSNQDYNLLNPLVIVQLSAWSPAPVPSFSSHNLWFSLIVCDSELKPSSSPWSGVHYPIWCPSPSFLFTQRQTLLRYIKSSPEPCSSACYHLISITQSVAICVANNLFHCAYPLQLNFLASSHSSTNLYIT